jgi:hypothetical protein
MMPDADSPELNPYASPLSEEPFTGPGSPELTEAERIRQEFIGREASIKSIGTLCYLGAVFSGFYALAFSGLGATDAEMRLVGIVLAIFCALMAILHGWIGHGLRKLHKKLRIAAIVISVLWMLNIPIGTILGIIAVFKLGGDKGSYIFSDEYRQIVDATPQIRYRTSRTAWIVLALLIATIVVLIVGMVAWMP